MAQKREGMVLAKEERSAKAKKRRRVKTFQAISMKNNMVRHLGLPGLSHFKVEGCRRAFVGVTVQVESSPRVSRHGTRYGLHVWLFGIQPHAGYLFSSDLSHGSHNAAKNTIRSVGLYRHEMVYGSAQNVSYGPALSPARLQQTREIVDEWFRTGDPNTDAWFLLHLPHLIKQMQLQHKVTDEGCAEVLTRYGYSVSKQQNMYTCMY